MPAAPILQTVRLTKRYGELTAVEALSLDVYEGEVFGFLGPNGAGKTTSINMICGLLKPDSGQVYLHGQLVNGGVPQTRRRVGVCPQQTILWEHLTCLEQLQFIGEMYGVKGGEARRRGLQLLEQLDLGEKGDKQARTLSGGMQRRLNLALALVHDPEIVILDEPEAGLDPQSRVRVREYIQSLARRKTIILTTHNMDEAERLAERIAIIDHGRLLVLDTPRALKARLGEGDVLEIPLSEWALDEGVLLENLQTALAPLDGKLQFHITGGALTVRAYNLVGLLPSLLEILKSTGIQPEELRLRQNSLEDVFIHLTGRKLRE
jgi:ABC-2 type transport system ATP-binding protein